MINDGDFKKISTEFKQRGLNKTIPPVFTMSKDMTSTENIYYMPDDYTLGLGH
jgi:hypothetical protein